mmetsp:Transcript_22828/g.73937  ORF Transcript_22828/g.73937 Transcript_22828/m.73937 type:complete len:266 (+) Transcript_22828:683-1480(+)
MAAAAPRGRLRMARWTRIARWTGIARWIWWIRSNPKAEATGTKAVLAAGWRATRRGAVCAWLANGGRRTEWRARAAPMPWPSLPSLPPPPPAPPLHRVAPPTPPPAPRKASRLPSRPLFKPLASSAPPAPGTLSNGLGSETGLIWDPRARGGRPRIARPRIARALRRLAGRRARIARRRPRLARPRKARTRPRIAPTRTAQSRPRIAGPRAGSPSEATCPLPWCSSRSARRRLRSQRTPWACRAPNGGEPGLGRFHTPPRLPVHF